MSEAMIIRRGGANKKLQTKTIAPSTSQQVVTPDSGYDGFESVTVSAITPVKAAQTYTPGTSNQTISSGQWLTGAQTIQGSANLIAGNIKNGVSIFGITGTYNGEGFDANGAVLKVVTSTSCTILVTGTGYNTTHQQADGFPRSSDANVTEHFFSIPASAFGTITVKATNTYGDNTKTITVNTAGKLYEIFVSAPNIILNSTFGLQSGFLNKLNITYGEYNELYKSIRRTSSSVGLSGNISDIPIGPYNTLQITATRHSSQTTTASLEDQDNTELSSFYFNASGSRTVSDTITNKYYTTAILRFYSPGFYEITEIVLS